MIYENRFELAQDVLYVGYMRMVTLSVSRMTLLVEVIASKLRGVFDRLIPVGYQDDQGFHFGEQSAPEAHQVADRSTP